MKMTKHAFIEKIRRCNVSKELSDEYLAKLHGLVRKSPLEFPTQNKPSLGDYFLLKRLEGRRASLDIFACDVAEAICSKCTFKVYKTILEKNHQLLLPDIIENGGTSIFLQALRKLNLKAPIKSLLYFLSERLDSREMIDLFFNVYYEYEDMGGEDALDVQRIGTSLYTLPFNIFKGMHQKQEPSSSSIFTKPFKETKEGSLVEECKRACNKFIIHSSTLKDMNFKSLVRAGSAVLNQDNNKFIVEMVLNIINKNCFRISVILDDKGMVTDMIIGNPVEEKFDELLQKMVELELRKEFCTLITMLEETKLLDHVIVSINRMLRENIGFVDSMVLECIKGVIALKEDEHTFESVILLQKKCDVFNYIVRIKETKDSSNETMRVSYEERFKDILKRQKHLIRFFLSSPSVLNNKTVEQFFIGKMKGTCPLHRDMFRREEMDTKLIYLILKSEEINTREMFKYVLWIINLISSSLPLLICLFIRLQKVFRSLRSEYFVSSLLKIFISRIKKVIKGEMVCVNKGCVHDNVWDDVDVIIKYMLENEMVDRSSVAFYYGYRNVGDGSDGDIGIHTQENRDVYEI
jgi:hypothetical protein